VCVRSVRELETYKTIVADGSCSGRIKDIYFNDRTWIVTHLLLSLGSSRFARKQVLVPWDEVTRVSSKDGFVHFRLSSAELEELPPPNSVMPVCKQYAALALGSPGARLFADKLQASNPNTRTAKAVIGYSIQADGESCGRLDDLIFDEESFEIRYLAIGQLLAGKKLQFHIVPKSVERFTWATQRVILRELQPICLEGGQNEAAISAAA